MCLGNLPWQSYFTFVTSQHLFFSIIGENLNLSFLSFTFIPKILQSSISSLFTTRFRHDSQKTSMPPCLLEVSSGLQTPKAFKYINVA